MVNSFSDRMIEQIKDPLPNKEQSLGQWSRRQHRFHHKLNPTLFLRQLEDSFDVFWLPPKEWHHGFADSVSLAIIGKKNASFARNNCRTRIVTTWFNPQNKSCWGTQSSSIRELGDPDAQTTTKSPSKHLFDSLNSLLSHDQLLFSLQTWCLVHLSPINWILFFDILNRIGKPTNDSILQLHTWYFIIHVFLFTEYDWMADWMRFDVSLSV